MPNGIIIATIVVIAITAIVVAFVMTCYSIDFNQVDYTLYPLNTMLVDYYYTIHNRVKIKYEKD